MKDILRNDAIKVKNFSMQNLLTHAKLAHTSVTEVVLWGSYCWLLSTAWVCACLNCSACTQ